MFTADQLVAHAIGDYILQSHRMAQDKLHSLRVAIMHGAFYAVPFWFLTDSWTAILVIAGTHAIIDRYRLARYVCWLKNEGHNIGVEGYPFRGVWRRKVPGPVTATGYPDDTPPWLAVWLLIITDNLIHVCINAAALRWLT